MEKIKKRLIGVEDIAFDASGNGGKDSYVLSDGKNINVKRLNASYIPLTAELREKLTGAENIEDGLRKINDSIPDVTLINTLTEDVYVEFPSDATDEDINDTIKKQIKNLGGHTISFRFPNVSTLDIYQPLLWEGFYNGTVFIDCYEPDLYDGAAISGLFEFRNCSALIKIFSGAFHHTRSRYAINAYATPNIEVESCSFYGMETKESYAFGLTLSNVTFESNSFYYDAPAEILDVVGDSFRKLSDELETGKLIFKEDSKDAANIVTRGNRLILSGGETETRGGNLRLYGENYEYNGSESMSGGFALHTVLGGATKNVLIGRNDNGLLWGELGKEKNIEIIDSVGEKYIRFASGLQICWGEEDKGAESLVTLPKAFANTEYYAGVQTLGDDGHTYQLSVSDRTTTAFKIHGYDGGENRAKTWIAIGKWK